MPLVVLDSPVRSLMDPLLEYVEKQPSLDEVVVLNTGSGLKYPEVLEGGPSTA